jgi:hypothetical protein
MERLVRRYPFPYANPAISDSGAGEVAEPVPGMTGPAHAPSASRLRRSDRLIEQDAAFIVRR